jgi:hypothetical protein
VKGRKERISREKQRKRIKEILDGEKRHRKTGEGRERKECLGR